MKKQLLSIAFIGASISSFAQLWMPVNSNLDTTSGIRYMSAVDTNVIWAIGYDGNVPARTYNKFTRTIDGGNFVSGNFFADTNTFSPSNISAVDANTAFISSYAKAGDGTPGQIIKTTDGGLSWININDTAMYRGAANFPNIVHFWDVNNGWTQGDPNNTFGSGNEFEIWRTNNGGTNWTRVPGANIPNPLSGEYGTVDVYTTFGDHHIWYGTNKGRIFRSSDTGATWQAVQLSGMAGGVYGLAFRDSLNGMVWGAATTAATPTIVFRVTSDGGATFTALNTTNNTNNIGWTAVDNVPGTNAYMSVGLTISRTQYVTSISKDDGLTWTVLEAGTTNTERIIELEVLDSLHAWGGNFSDNSLPLGFGGMAKYAGPVMHTIGVAPVATKTTLFEAYPNPNTGIFNLKFDKVIAGSTLKVSDVLGKEAFTLTLNSSSLNKEIKIDLSSFAKGIYLLNLTGPNGNISKKIIVE